MALPTKEVMVPNFILFDWLEEWERFASARERSASLPPCDNQRAAGELEALFESMFGGEDVPLARVRTPIKAFGISYRFPAGGGAAEPFVVDQGAILKLLEETEMRALDQIRLFKDLRLPAMNAAFRAEPIICFGRNLSCFGADFSENRMCMRWRFPPGKDPHIAVIVAAQNWSVEIRIDPIYAK